MREIRLWLRRVRRAPVSNLFVLLSLTVSLAGGLAALSLAAGVLWRALPFVDADGLVTLEIPGQEKQPRWWSWPEFESIAANPPAPLSRIAAYTAVDVNALSEPGRPPETLLGTLVSAEVFPDLRIGVSLDP